VTRTEQEGPGDGALDLDADFADYYDDAPVSAPAMLRAPTPLGGVPVRRPPSDPRANPAVGAKPDLDSPFLGLFPGAAPPSAVRPTGSAPVPMPPPPARVPGQPSIPHARGTAPARPASAPPYPASAPTHPTSAPPRPASAPPQRGKLGRLVQRFFPPDGRTVDTRAPGSEGEGADGATRPSGREDAT
jgi:hypothetical protein